MNPRQLLTDLKRLPWKSIALTLRERFREDRLGLTASSLTFTTTIALVPFFTVALAVFTAFPIFNQLQGSVQGWLVQSLIPDAIARQVLGYLTQFAGKASRLGAVGLGALAFTTLALVMTIDRTLNGIWRVKRRRSLARRVLIYWAVITLAPLLLGASLSLTSYALSASRGLVGNMPGTLKALLDFFEFLVLTAALAALYRYVPNTHVRRSHAWAGAFFAAIGIEVAKKFLAVYIAKVPTYSLVYGAFATLPILLVWIYVAWVIVLLGAVIAAYLPSLLVGAARRGNTQGWRFELALEVLQRLHAARAQPRRGISMPELMEALHAESLQLEPVLETLVSLDWIGRINEVEDEQDTRYILLAEPAATALAPLMRVLLLPVTDVTATLWKSGQLESLRLQDVL